MFGNVQEIKTLGTFARRNSHQCYARKNNCSRYLSADIGWELSKNSKRESPVMKYLANY